MSLLSLRILLLRLPHRGLSLALLPLPRLLLPGHGLRALLHVLLLQLPPHLLHRLLVLLLSFPCQPSLLLLPCLLGLFALPCLLLLLLLLLLPLYGEGVNGLLSMPLVHWFAGSSLTRKIGAMRGLFTWCTLALLSTSPVLLLGRWGVRQWASAEGLVGIVTRAGNRLASGHVATRNVSSVVVHGLRLRRLLVETRSSKALRRRSWCVFHRIMSIVASKVTGGRVPAVRRLLIGRRMKTGIARRRRSRIDREVVTVEWSEGHCKSSLVGVLAVLARTRWRDTIRHSMGRKRWSVSGREPVREARRSRIVLKVAMAVAVAGVLVVASRCVGVYADEGTHVLLDSRVLRALKRKHRAMGSSGVGRGGAKQTNLSPFLASLLL